MVKLQISKQDEITVISINETINQENVYQFKVRINEIISSGEKWVVLDFRQAQYLSSMGLALIVDCNNRLSDNGGGIKLAYVNPLIDNLLKQTQLNKMIGVCSSVKDAIEDIKKRDSSAT